MDPHKILSCIFDIIPIVLEMKLRVESIKIPIFSQIALFRISKVTIYFMGLLNR